MKGAGTTCSGREGLEGNREGNHREAQVYSRVLEWAESLIFHQSRRTVCNRESGSKEAVA